MNNEKNKKNTPHMKPLNKEELQLRNRLGETLLGGDKNRVKLSTVTKPVLGAIKPGLFKIATVTKPVLGAIKTGLFKITTVTKPVWMR